MSFKYRRAGPNTMSRFETEVLTQEGNLEGLALLNTEWVERAMAHAAHKRAILDMDSSESPVPGKQEEAADNGHFESVCYHPLFLFNHLGDCEGAMIRSGNVHGAERWRQVLEPVVNDTRKRESGCCSGPTQPLPSHGCMRVKAHRLCHQACCQ